MRYVIRNKMDQRSYWSMWYMEWTSFEKASSVSSEDRVNIMLPPNGVWVAL